MRPIRRRAVLCSTLLLFCCQVPAATAEVPLSADSLGIPVALTDAEIEKLLVRGRITRMVRLDVGVTQPWRVWVELGKRRISGCFKSVDIVKMGITQIPGAKTEIHFTDRHQYDQAAYRLDRELGLSLVPVAVPRHVRGDSGTLIFWVDDVFDEKTRIVDQLKPPTTRKLNHQLACMRLFDALIYNIDRNSGNILYSQSDWQLHLIDHTRSFRLTRELPEDFLTIPTTLPRSLYDRLGRLEERRLQRLLKGLVNRGQIRALMRRRDLIVEKIERDRRAYGDAKVFQQTVGAPEGVVTTGLPERFP